MNESRRAKSRVKAWALGARGSLPASGVAFGDSALLRSWRSRLAAWIEADMAPGRLIPWLPIGFGLGIAIYFSAASEPMLWAGLIVSFIAVVLCIWARARPLAWPLTIGFAAITIGFTLATWKSVRVAHPVLTAPVFGVTLTGFVEMREERERSDRITLRVHSMTGARSGIKLERVRLSVRKGTAPAVASFIEVKARLNPPLTPLLPGGYDFARDYYFQRLGATGFVLGQIRHVAAPEPPGLYLRYVAAIGSLRDTIDVRIRSALSGDKGAIASALITGKRDAISSAVNDAMYVSSLAHVLSISGYHMALVAGLVFFVVRACLALFPFVASRYPIKKWAAGAALVMAAFYLLLSGAEIATQRAFIMTSIVLIGVMFDRPALTLRTIAVAALVLLAISPEALVHPSFQMSFAATLALIAVYERGLPWLSGAPASSLGARIALLGGRVVVALVLASLVAGFATTLFAAYHFHRLAPYGVLANLAAMPVVSLWVMPAGLLGLLAIPFGFDGLLWRLMGEGIGWMIAVAAWVASLPGAVGRIPSFGIAPLLLGTAGLIVLCLLRSPLRWGGVALGVLCIAFAWATPRPDTLIAADAGMVAARDASGVLRVMVSRRDDFVLRQWLAADGDARTSRDASLTQDVRCDGIGYVMRLSEGRQIALAISADAVTEDCGLATLVVTARDRPRECAAQTIDRTTIRSNGAMSAVWNGHAFVFNASRSPDYRRPWTAAGTIRAPVMPQSAATTSPRDATPRSEDLDVEDAGSVTPE